MKRLRAFTLVEVMVVSLLTVVTVGLAMTAWHLMEQQYIQYGKETGDALQLGQLQMLLEKDFMQSKLVTKEDFGLRFSYPQFELRYEFREDRIVRKLAEEGSREDVFRFGVTGWEAYFRQVPIEAGTTDYLKLSTTMLEQPVSLAFSKTYSAQELINSSHGH